MPWCGILSLHAAAITTCHHKMLWLVRYAEHGCLLPLLLLLLLVLLFRATAASPGSPAPVTTAGGKSKEAMIASVHTEPEQ
jgi:hypothetical protein